MIHYAIGDIHGRDDLLETMHQRITWHRDQHYPGQPATLVYVGDYIDRGPDSLAVIDRVMAGLAGFGTVALRGNHEDFLLRCLETDEEQDWAIWFANGGENSLTSFGLNSRLGGYRAQELAEALGEARIGWLRELKLYHLIDGYLFVHAGIAPGVALAEQDPQDLMWIRYRFLDSNADHGFRVVHGHTPMDAPEVRHNRIGIDTGAIVNGILTTVVIAPGKETEFLQVRGEPTR